MTGRSWSTRAQAAAARALRRRIPSVARLSGKPIVSIPVAGADRVVARLFPLAEVPPARLRLRIGMSRPGLDQVEYRYMYDGLWLYLFATGIATATSDVVDLGCGLGRVVEALRRPWYHGHGFQGRYLGIDVDPELLAWAADHAPPGFEFARVPGRSSVYQPDGIDGPPRIPAEGASFDLAVSGSLFTHLLGDDVRGYLEECHRVLRPGGHAFLSAYCLEDLAALGHLGGRHTFGHRVGEAWVNSVAFPEAAVAYERDVLTAMARGAGFADVTIRPGLQSMIELRR